MSIKQDMLKATDAVAGRAAAWVLGRRRRSSPAREPPAGPPKRALVIRPGGIGDAVLFIPMLEALRRAWPETEIDVLVERRNAGILEGSALADRVYLYDRPLSDLRKVLARRYDVVIDTEQHHRLSAIVAWLTGAPRRIGFGSNDRRRLLTDAIPYSQSLYEVYSFLELARLATGRAPDWDPECSFFPVPPAAESFAAEALAPLDGLVKVAIHPGASIPERRWPPERYAEVAHLLAQRGVGVVVLGGPGDRKAGRAIVRALNGLPHVDLAGRCSLVQAAAVVARVSVYLSADSGVLHLAYGVGTPTVHLFGPGVLSKWGPPGSKFRSVKNPVPCSPCTRYGYTPPCCQGLVCMLGISPEGVFRAVWERLEQEAMPASVPGARR